MRCFGLFGNGRRAFNGGRDLRCFLVCRRLKVWRLKVFSAAFVG